MNFDSEIDAYRPIYAINKIANAIGVSVQTLSLYEKEYLIISNEKASKHRLNSNDELERLQFIGASITNNKVDIGGLKIILSLIHSLDNNKCYAEKSHFCLATTSQLPCCSSQPNNNHYEGKRFSTCVFYKDYNSRNKIKNGIKDITGNQ